jgi:NADPH:quinone reductase-like Zn-dependent oxidoreductase
MKAIVQDRYGPPDVLQVREIDRPVCGDDDVLVRVHAAAVNARDWHVMRGDPWIARLLAPAELGRSGPRVGVRGTDFAGRVEAVGRSVTRFRPGDDVFGEFSGAFAEYVRVPAGLVEPRPVNLTFEQAAAMPLAANTALVALRDAAGVRPGQQVLINGASGGVGTFAVQIARCLGAEVTGVCSTRNLQLVADLGADRVIDYTAADFVRDGRRYDVVLDLVGNRSLRDCRRVLKPAGTLVLSGGGVFTGGSLIGPMALMIRAMAVSRFVRHRVVVLTATPSGPNLAVLRELAESGRIAPVIDRTYPLREASDAIRYLEHEHARAKVVLTGFCR